MEWNSRIRDVKIQKEQVNKLIMNYLVIEGFKDAAQHFQEETGYHSNFDLESISERMAVRQAIEQGNIILAAELVNDLDPEILDTHPKLFFHLQQQRLIELIREDKIEAALIFAQEELAPRGEEHPEFLEDLEQTMTLLALPSPLLDAAQRQKIASELNASILESQCVEKEAKLVALLKMLNWAQKELEDRVTYPKILQLDTPQ